ncbi:MAG: cyclodeaminase/cyclohydrolase family protein [Eubacteriales bacterium]
MLIDKTIVELLAETAGDSAVPGGGSIAALSGASAAALVEMVANLTIGKKNYEDVSDLMIGISEKASLLRVELLEAVDRDSDAFSKVMEAFKLPKETQEEKEARTIKIQSAFKQAAIVPLGVAQKSKAVLDLAKDVVLKGNKNAVTDGAVAGMMARSAALGAIYNVGINLVSIKDEDFVKKVSVEIDEIKAYVIAGEQEIFSNVVIA